MTQIRDRHNKIVDRIVNAVRFGEITTDRAIRESGLHLRPDIVVKDHKNVLIIDVTCPFDNDVNVLADAAEHKYTIERTFHLSLVQVRHLPLCHRGTWLVVQEQITVHPTGHDQTQ